MKYEYQISVILPSLNVVNYIDECLESVKKQTCSRIEMICVDAGSNDGTYEYLIKMSKNDKRIKVIRSEKKSYGYQLNLGIKQAKGKYIAIVETDDLIESHSSQGPDIQSRVHENVWEKTDIHSAFQNPMYLGAVHRYNVPELLFQCLCVGKQQPFVQDSLESDKDHLGYQEEHLYFRAERCLDS